MAKGFLGREKILEWSGGLDSLDGEFARELLATCSQLAIAALAAYGEQVDLFRELPLHDTAGNLRVVVETPRGSAVKLKYDGETGTFVWSRPLSLGIQFPYDFGFLPQTIGGDGEGLDAMVLADVPSYPGVVVCGRAIGALRIEQHRAGQAPKRNDRIFIVPANGHRRAELSCVHDLPKRIRQELEAFFLASLSLTGKNVSLCGWADAEETTGIVAEGHRQFRIAEGSPP